VGFLEGRGKSTGDVKAGKVMKTARKKGGNTAYLRKNEKKTHNEISEYTNERQRKVRDEVGRKEGTSESEGWGTPGLIRFPFKGPTRTGGKKGLNDRGTIRG